MSIRLVQQEINRFLESDDPEVICIKGKWGVGKTYTWNKYLHDAISQNKVKLKKYSYVSLFGQNSVEDLKNSIFENTEDINQVHKISTIDELYEKFPWLRKLRKGSRFVGMVPQLKEYLPAVFLNIRNQIICIDDLERKGKDISTSNIFGLVSLLKEQRKCKIILLLNDEKLEGGDSDDFQKYLEKVVDVDMKFQPTAAEAADIAIDKSSSFYQKFTEICVALNIVNIRIIRKIERIIKNLEKLLEKHDKKILKSSLLSLILFCWACYEPGTAPSIKYLKGFNRFFPDSSKDESQEEASWRQLINSIDYWTFNEFDGILVTSVQNGFFDSNVIEKAARDLDKTFTLQEGDNSFHAAWQKYHNSFDNNQDEVLNGLYNAFKKNIGSISPMNADSTISFLRKFGLEDQADELVEYYMTNRNEAREFYDPSHSVFLQLKDSKLSDAFKKKLEAFVDNRTPEEILIKIAQQSGWNPEDISTLSKVSEDQFYELFKNLSGDNLRIVVSRVLKFKQYTSTNDVLSKIVKNAESALVKIAEESQINRERIISYGVHIADQPD